MVDHRRHALLDCCKRNLRGSSAKLNSANRRKRLLYRSAYKGVYWRERRGLWESYIRVDGHLRFLGSSPAPIVCARLYDAAAREAFGPFAYVNGV